MCQEHCGSLYLDPAALAETAHELLLLESMQREKALLGGVAYEAVSTQALTWRL